MSKELLKDETLAEKLIKRGFWIYLFSFLIAPSGYIIKLLISNDLSVEEVGVIYAILGFIGILANYNDLGFTESLKYFLPKFWINKKYDEFKTSIFLALGIQTFTAIIIAIGLWFGADFLSQNYFHSIYAGNVLKVFILFFVFYNIFNTFDTIFFAFQDTFANKFIEFLRMWGIVIFIAILFFTNHGSLLNYSIAWLVGMILGLFFGIFYFLKKYRWTLDKGKLIYSKKLNKEIFSYAAWVVLASQGGMVLGSLDLQMIVYFLGPQQAGFYTNYLSILNIYSILIGPIFGFLFPITTELIEKKQHWKLELMMSIFYKYFVVIGWIIGVFFAIFGPYIAYILFGEKFIPSGNLLQFSAWFIFVSIIISINFNVLAGLGKIKQRVKIIYIAAGLNFVLNWILIQKIGIIGAVIATIFSSFVMLILSYFEIKKSDIKINFDWKFYIKNFLILGLLGVIFYFSLNYLNFENRLEILGKMFIFWVVYVIVLLVGNYKEVKILIKQVKGMR